MTYHNPVQTCTAISVNGYFPLYTTASCAQTHAGGDGTYHTHLLNSITYYMPSGLVLGVTFFHGDYGVTTTVERAPAPPGYHYMPDGSLMLDSEMESTTVERAPAPLGYHYMPDGSLMLDSEMQTSQTVNQDELIENYTPLDSSFTPREESDTEYIDVTGQVWTGQTHIIPGGKIMAGTIEENLNEELRTVTLIYLTPSGKQWCGSWHKSMLGTLMSGIARDKFGSGTGGKSEILSKKLIGDGKGLEEHGYKSCKTDEPKPSWDCTMGGCMLLPSWWPPGQFTGPNAYFDCQNACKSWKCASFVLFPPFNFDLCLCAPVHGTGATQTYPTSGLCWAAAQTDPCCTDDKNTYNCTINGCEVHTGPGVGTYNQVPYALWECQQECRAWGCHDVYTSSAYTTTGISYTDFSFSTPHTSADTANTVVWTSAVTTTVPTIENNTCIHVYYDATSMDGQLTHNAEQAITDWRDAMLQPGELLSAWTGIFISTNMNQNVGQSPPSTVVNGVGGTKYTNERWLTWPWMTLDLIQTQGGAMPCISDPQNLTTTPSIPHAYSQLHQMSCSCRSVLVISLIDESDSIYNNPTYVPTTFFDNDRQNYIDTYNDWTANGGKLYHLVYPASKNNVFVNQLESVQMFLAIQGTNFDTANNGNVLTYDPTYNNVSHINGNPIFGNPAQSNLAPPLVHNFKSWIETPWSSIGANYGGNPFLDLDSNGNAYEPLEDYGTYGVYNRRGLNAFSISTLGEDLNDFLSQNPVISTQVTWTSANTITTTLVHWLTWTHVTYTAVTSTTITTNWWLYDVCLSAETIPYIDYPYLFPADCIELKCERPGYSCGPNGCYEQWNGEFFDLHNCELACLSWSCVTKTGGLEPEQGWQTALGATPPITCQGTMEDLQGNTVSAYHPVTGNTYDFVAHCFGIYQSSTVYQPNVGVLLGGLWDNTGTSWVQGVTTTTTQNGLVVIDTGGGNCKTWHPDYPSVPGRTTRVTYFILRDLNGNVLYKHGSGTYNTMINVWSIMDELANGIGYGWYNINISPDWPTGMPSFVVGPGIPLDKLIAYGNNATGDNDVKEFTVEVEIHGCPCEQICYCDLIPGIDAANIDIWPVYIQSQFPTLVLTPNARTDCKDKCCEKVKTWKCPDDPNKRALLCIGCPNGGGCYDPLDGSGLHSTQSDCEDDCAVSYNCFSATPISAVTTYSANTTCEHVDYTMVNGEYLYLLPYSGIPVTYFQEQEPIETQNGVYQTALGNFSGWTWGDAFGGVFKFDYGAVQGTNVGGVSNAFEAFIYIFDEKNGLHDIEFNKIGFWTGNIWNNDTTHTCEYPSPQGDKELGVMEGFYNSEFSLMYCIDYEIRENERPWVSTLDPLLNGVPHPKAISHNGQWWVQGAATMCGRKTGERVPHMDGFDKVHTMTHSLADGAQAEVGGATRSPKRKYLFKSVKDLKDKIHWMYSRPTYVDTYGWGNLNLYGLPDVPTSSPVYGTSKNQTNLGRGACTRIATDLARLYNQQTQFNCLDPLTNTSFQRPHPTNGLKTVSTVTPDGLQLKDFWSIGMFRNRGPLSSKWRFTPFYNYWGLERRADDSGPSGTWGTNFMTLGLGYNLEPGLPGNYAFSTWMGPGPNYGLIGRSSSIHGDTLSSGLPVASQVITSFLGPKLACMCEMPCYCEIINGDQGDYETQTQCHSNCCPNYYYYICCQPDTNPAPTSIPPFQASCLYSISNCHCPPGSHQVACPW